MVHQADYRESGASLVEFALLAPLLLLLLLGIVEFGWLFGQLNDVKHGAREGARFAAVDAGATGDIVNYVCDSMDGLSAGMTQIEVTLTGGGAKGSIGTIAVDAQVASLSGVPFITPFLPSSLSSEVDFRLEQASSWIPHVGSGGTC